MAAHFPQIIANKDNPIFNNILTIEDVKFWLSKRRIVSYEKVDMVVNEPRKPMARKSLYCDNADFPNIIL
jgi:hypothetical protein